MNFGEDLLNHARLFAYKAISGHNGKFDKYDYYSFLISYFLLFKELIVKKDDTHQIFFDVNKNGKYLNFIKDVVDAVKDGGVVQMNSASVIITPSIYDTPEMRQYIWIFNKIRDSICHGAYHFDFLKNGVVINNDHSHDPDPYALVGFIPIHLFERDEVVYGFSSIKNSFTTFVDYDPNKIGSYSYDITVHYPNNYPSSYTINSYDDYGYVAPKTLSKSKKLNYYQNSYILPNTPSDYKITNTYNIRNNKVNDYINDIEYYTTYVNYESEEQRKLVLTYKFKRLISEMGKMMKSDKTGTDKIKLVSMYNYMQTLFSSRDYDFKNDADVLKLGFLKISKMHPHYVVSQDDLSDDPHSQYAENVEHIKTITRRFIKKAYERIANFNKKNNASVVQSLNDLMKDYYTDVISSFAKKNKLVLTSIRNAVEHGNIHEASNNIVLHDQSSPKDINTMKFFSYAKVEDVFNMIAQLDAGIKEESFTFDDFLGELKSILDANLFNELIKVFEEIRKVDMIRIKTILESAQGSDRGL